MADSWKWYVYIVECLNGNYYTGCTWNVASRLIQHVSGYGAKYTGRYGVKRLVYYEEHENLETARIREKKIKNWNQEKKKKLINGEWKKDWSGTVFDRAKKNSLRPRQR